MLGSSGQTVPCAEVVEHSSGMLEGIFPDGSRWLSETPWLAHLNHERARAIAAAEGAKVEKKPSAAPKRRGTKRPAAAEAAEGPEDPCLAGAGASEAAEAAEAKRLRHNAKSKAYHQARARALKEGRSDDEARRLANEASAQAGASFDPAQ
jgi:hypothetical protein